METITASQEDSSNANPASVKSDDSTPPPEGGRGSPPPNCAICLGTCKNKSFTDSCLHQFCFSCLLTWSKVKAECPLCKQNFKSIIHNVRSNHQYEEYMVEQRHVEENIDIDSISIEGLAQATRRFRYRTTLTLPRRDSRAIEQFLMHYPLIPRLPHARAPPARRRRSPAAFRRTVYRHNLWARPLPDFTGRFRDCSPEFYMYNDAQMHRLVPWLTRELQYLLNENAGHISYVLTRVLELLPQRPVTSPEFRDALRRYLGDRTDHFLHELHCFASTPYDMTGYDRNVQYTTDPRVSTLVNEVLSSSASDSDSDIVMLSSEPLPGPSRPAPAPADCVIPIETISHSDTDDGSEVMVVGYIKPPQDRTPEVVDLLGSDSDVVLHDAPGPSRATATASAEPPEPLVKLSLKRHSPPAKRESVSSSSSSPAGSAGAAGGARRRKRRRSASPAAWRPWGSPSPARSSSSSTVYTWGTATSAATPSPLSSSSSSSSDCSSSSDSSSTSDSDTAAASGPSSSSPPSRPKRRRTSKKKYKLKSSKGKTSKRSKEDKKTSKSKSSKEESRSKSRKARKNQATQTKKESRKQKTRSGKGVKRSKVSEAAPGEPQAGPSSAPPPPPAASPSPPRAPSPPREPSPRAPTPPPRRRHSRALRDARRRLRSVVKVINTQQTSEPSGMSNLRNIMESAILNPNSNVLAYNSDSGSIPGDDRTRRLEEIPPVILEKAESCFNTQLSTRHSDSDSDDNLPLNLTLRRT